MSYNDRMEIRSESYWHKWIYKNTIIRKINMYKKIVIGNVTFNT